MHLSSKECLASFEYEGLICLNLPLAVMMVSTARERCERIGDMLSRGYHKPELEYMFSEVLLFKV